MAEGRTHTTYSKVLLTWRRQLVYWADSFHNFHYFSSGRLDLVHGGGQNPVLLNDPHPYPSITERLTLLAVLY